MKISERGFKWLSIAALVLLGFVFLYWFKHVYNGTPANTQAAQDTLGATAGPTGIPIAPQFQYGQAGPFQINLSDYNVPIPQFHYAGNTSIYMPMFGFVGYGAQPL